LILSWGDNKLNIIGIDPGLHGGIALIMADHGSSIVLDPPTLIMSGKGKRAKNKTMYQVSGVVSILEGWRDVYTPKAYIENVHSMPGQGVVAMFSMGRGLGMYEGILTALKIPFEFVTPQAWKKLLLQGQVKEKSASVYKAQQLFPSVELITKRGRLLDGRAEALLIAEYGYILNR